MFPDLEFIKTCLNGLRSQIERVENWVVSFVRANRPNWAQNDPDALDYVKGRTHWEEEAVVDMSGKLYKITGFTSNTLTVTYDVIPLELGQVWSVQGGNGSAYTNVEVQRNTDGVLYLGTLNVQPFYITKDTATINYSWFNSLKADSLTLTCTSGSATIRTVHSLNPKFLPTPTSNAIGAIKADSAKTTDIQPVRLGTDGKLYSSGVPIFTTSGTGSAYTANVPEINELVNGMLVVMIPHATSDSTAPTLNINGLGAHQIRRFKSTNTNAINSPTGIYSNWLKSGVPVILMYTSGFWYACSFTKPDASDLLGTIPVSKGGTNRTTLTQGSYLVGNGTGKVLLKTPSAVLADIGAIPVPATASVGQVIAVKAVDADGKPTEWIPVDFPSGSDMEIIATGELTEEATTINITVDNDGNPFELKEASFSIHIERSDSNSAQGAMRMRTNQNSAANGINGVYNNILGTIEGGRDAVFRFHQGDYINASAVITSGITTALAYINRNFSTLTALYLQGVTSGSETFGVGTKWTLRGVRV